MSVFATRLSAFAVAMLTMYQFALPATADESEPARQPPSEQWWLTQYGFVDAWSTTRGEGVLVAVIDTGIAADHPDLAGRVVGGKDFSGVGTPDGTTPVGSAAHHGSMVASLIVGQGESSGGVWGAAPEAELLSISIGLGVPGADTDAQVAAAIHWAVDAGADIINLSLSRASSDWPRSWDDALMHAFSSDVIVVAAIGSGVEGPATASAPGVIPGVVTVGAVARDGGPSEPHLNSVQLDVLAPGEQMLGSYPGGGVRSWEGASAATPIVSGLLALILAADPRLSSADAIGRLRSSATSVNPPDFDVARGFGTIDAASALSAKHGNPVSAPDPAAELNRWINLYRPSLGSADPTPTEGGQSLVVPSAPGAEVSAVDSQNREPGAADSGVIPLLLALFGFGLAISVLLILRGNGIRNTRKS